jgi:hypothetical protein
MKIDIDRLTEAELVDLNHRVVERLRLLQQMRSHVQMLEFKVGERVQFQPDGHPPVTGVLTRYNRKTVTVIAETGQQWNVAPQFLQRSASLRQTPVRSRDRPPESRQATVRTAAQRSARVRFGPTVVAHAGTVTAQSAIDPSCG